MPFLRVIRDKRGYETTYLMHLYRDGHRQRSRILYVFRTPGDVRVGRSSLEPDTLKQIEAQYPGIDFDWNVVVGNQQVVESAPDLRRPRKRRQDEEEGTGTDEPAAPPQPVVEPASQPGTEPVAISPRAEIAAAPAPRPPVPSTIQGDTPDEKIVFLAYWYGACRERILRRVTEAEPQDALLALAERLNPATWTDADQITAGLLQAEEALDRLSHVFAKRRRRTRRGPGRPPADAAMAPLVPHTSSEPVIPESSDSTGITSWDPGSDPPDP